MTGSASPLPATTPAAPVLRVNGVSCRWGTRTALEDVTFEIPAGQIFGLIGPNGAGKTTVLNMLGGFYTPDAGTIRLGTQSLEGKHAWDLHASQTQWTCLVGC